MRFRQGLSDAVVLLSPAACSAADTTSTASLCTTPACAAGERCVNSSTTSTTPQIGKRTGTMGHCSLVALARQPGPHTRRGSEWRPQFQSGLPGWVQIHRAAIHRPVGRLLDDMVHRDLGGKGPQDDDQTPGLRPLSLWLCFSTGRRESERGLSFLAVRLCCSTNRPQSACAWIDLCDRRWMQRPWPF